MNEHTQRKTNEEKLAILSEAIEQGVTATCEKYGIDPAIYIWRLVNIIDLSRRIDLLQYVLNKLDFLFPIL